MSHDPTSYVYQEPEERQFITLPKGEYDFKVVDVFELTQSKTGNDMIPIKLEIIAPDGTPVTVDEYLVFTDSARWKIDSFLKSIGPMPTDRPVNFTAGSFIAWIKKQTGRCKLGVEVIQGKTKEFEKNKVEAFLYDKAKTTPAPKSTPPPVEEDTDDIPF